MVSSLKDAEITHNMRGHDHIRRLRFVFSRCLSVARVPNQMILDFDGFSCSRFAEHQSWTKCSMFEMDATMDVIGGSSDSWVSSAYWWCSIAKHCITAGRHLCRSQTSEARGLSAEVCCSGRQTWRKVVNQPGMSVSVHLHEAVPTFLEYLEEDCVIDGVEGTAQVKQDQDTGISTTVHVAHYSVVDVDHDSFGRMVCAVCGLTWWQQIVHYLFIEAYRHHSFDGLR